MANARLSKALFILSILAVNEVVTMRTKVSSAKMARRSESVNSTEKTPDLDWEGCAAWTTSGCVSTEGCHQHYVWLDTWRQSCRYTDEFKLREDQIARFFPVELARLEEKTEIFAAHGCLTGGLWYKCYRRMNQILRLFNYVRKAKSIVQAAGDQHPAHGEVMSSATTQRFTRISENLATGFGKNKQTKDMCVHDGIRKMMSMPDEIMQMQREAEEHGMPLTEAEVSSIEQAKQSAALLAMNCQEVTDEQVQNMRAMIEATGEGRTTSPTGGKDELDDIVSDSEEMMNMLDETDRKKVQEASGERQDSWDPDEADDHELDRSVLTENDGKGGLLQLSGNQSSTQLSADGPLKILWYKGWGGLKWLVTHGLGWLFRRLVWTVVFLVGVAFSLVRAAVIWPILFVFCMGWRGLRWFFKDLLWDGKNIKKGFMNIGYCAPEMWDMVGFDTKDPGHSAVSQIVVQPAKAASFVSGVYHPLYNGTDHMPNPCRRVTCGQNAYCQVVDDKTTGNDVAKCFCYYGTYPLSSGPAHDCALKVTKNQCACKQRWSAWTMSYYGCNSDGQCKVDMSHPSYQTCKKAQNADGSFVGRMFNAATNSVREYDSCTWERSAKEVAPKAVDNTIDDYGKKIGEKGDKK